MRKWLVGGPKKLKSHLIGSEIFVLSEWVYMSMEKILNLMLISKWVNLPLLHAYRKSYGQKAWNFGTSNFCQNSVFLAQTVFWCIWSRRQICIFWISIKFQIFWNPDPFWEKISEPIERLFHFWAPTYKFRLRKHKNTENTFSTLILEFFFYNSRP
jgi:hypothetical protein